MIFLIDNCNSFSYNLAQMIGSINQDIQVVRNDKVTIREIENPDPSHLALSPSSSYPGDAGIMGDAIRQLKGRVPILGVYLGHQGIREAFGGTISHTERLVHGKQNRIELDNRSPLFKGLLSRVQAARYHSLAAQSGNLPEELEVVIRDCEVDEITAVQYRKYHVYELWFHPESILTPDGSKILENSLSITQSPWWLWGILERDHKDRLRDVDAWA